MLSSRKNSISIAVAILTAGFFVCNFHFFTAEAQTRLTYPEINTALQTKLPNRSFKNKTELISWIIVQVKNRKIDKPLTKDREDDLRQAGATDDLVAVIRANSPKLPVPTPEPRETAVDLGDLLSRAVNLIKPEYTAEAKQAGTTGEVKLALELDQDGRVTSVTPITVLPNGLTEQAAAAARQTKFTPATAKGKPARGSGTITYGFKISKINVAATLAAADDFLNKTDCDHAIVEYTRVIDIDIKQSRAFFGRGLCYLIKSRYDQAVTDLESAASLNQGGVDTFFYLAIAYDFKGDVHVATDNYSKAVSLKPELDKRDLTTCLFIERSKVSQDEAKAAGNRIVEACSQSLHGTPDFLASLIYVKRGIGFRLKSDYDKAISDFETAAKLNPQFTAVKGHLHSAYNSRGLLYFNKKEFKLALDDINKAISLNPEGPTPYINRCAIHLYALKEYDQAIDDCSTAIRIGTKSSMAYNHRGYAYEMKKNLDAAVADYKKALEIDPGNDTARTNLNRLQNPGRRN